MSIGASIPAVDLGTVADSDGASLMAPFGAGRRMSPQSPNEALQPEAPPPPPRSNRPPSRKRPRLSAFSGFLSFLVIGALGVLVLVAFISNRLREPGPLQADKVVYIAQRTDLPDIIEKLHTEGVVDSPVTLNAILTLERKRTKVKFGEYLFKAHASLRSVVDTLVSGKQILHPITIPEGLTSAQIVQRLRDNDVLVGDIRALPKEGALLPETYKVSRGMSRPDLVNLMEAANRKMVEQIWSRRAPDLPLRSPYELVTLASIVEKETGKADERPHIAGVFINRLQKRMRLQSDPTIVYGLVGGQGTLGHAILRSELDKRTPYNTYQIDGLPPGPIDNPGRAALEAVANPSRTRDLYFVADGTGGHVFSETVEDHNRNVQRWRQIEREKDKEAVDKLAPSAVTPPARSNQRSDASGAEDFGFLPGAIAPVSTGRVAIFMDPRANHDIDKVAAAEDAGPASTRAAGHKGRAAPRVDLGAMSASLDTMGFSIAGAPAGQDASALLDGPVPDGAAPESAASRPMATPNGAPNGALAFAAQPASVSTAPTMTPAKSPGRTQTARAALDAMPGDDHPDLFADPGPNTVAVPTKTPPLHPKIYDVSEGTDLDPLKNKSFDLNSGKTIPDALLQKR